ncbi:MAG TPA: GntR family transcriptional regulator [Gaiellaceae bacterium]|nr:GntR family transcriptional regulator [Gaiellaceae bacterium]
MAAASGTVPALVRESPVPLHSQLRHLLVGMIEEGQFQAGEPFPPERELAERFGVSLAPVRQAILDLVGEGVLYRVRGKGTFLHEPALVENVSILSSFTASMRERGLDVEMRLLRRETRRGWVTLERLAVVEGEPAGLFASRLSTKRFPGIGERLVRRGSLWDVLERDYGTVAVRADTIVEVGRCTTEHSALLRIPAGSSLLIAQGTTYDVADEAVESFHVRYRADRIRLRLDSYRSGNPPEKG